MDGRNEDGGMLVSGDVVPNNVYVPVFVNDFAAVSCGTNLENLRESAQ